MDYSIGGASASQIPGRSDVGGEAVSAPLSVAILQFWMWMSLQVSACLELTTSLAKSALPKLASKPSHIFVLPSADPSAPQQAVRVNRSIMRKLRRLERLRPDVFLKKPEPLPDWVRDLSPTQYLEYLIRVHRWSRVRSYRLGAKWRDKLRHAVEGLVLQGDAGSLRWALTCNALITPD